MIYLKITEINNMLQKVKKYLVFILFLFIIYLLNCCKNKKSETGMEIIARTPVTVAQPVLKDMQEILEFPAITTYLTKYVVRSSITGTVEKVAVTQGDKIKKGALLFVLKTREAAALQDSASVDQDLGFNGTINVISPNDGNISTISHQGGDFVQEGDDLVLISDPRSLVFLLEAPFEMTGYVDRNKSCLLTLPDNTRINGKISGRLPEMNVQNQTVSYIVNANIPEPLPENLIASAVIIKSTKTGAVVIPRKALLGNETMNEFWVMKVINDSTAIKVPVSRGIETDNEIEITDPVFLPSDRLILTGNYGLPDTASIIIEK